MGVLRVEGEQGGALDIPPRKVIAAAKAECALSTQNILRPK